MRLECLEERWVPAFPVAVNDAFAVPNGPNTLDVLANDPFSQQAQISSFTQVPADQGTLAQNADGTFAFTPAPGFTGAQFSYTLSPKNAQTPLTASSPAKNAFLGDSVTLSTDGNTAVVGAPSIGGTTAGHAYVFVRSGAGWVQQAVLNGTQAGDSFGGAVALSDDGNTLIVGAENTTVSGATRAGEAFVFTRNGSNWTQQQVLTASDAASKGLFGSSVSLSADGNTALVGASGTSVTFGGTTPGKAYVFVRSGGTWAQQAGPLTASGAAAGDLFGSSVSLSDDGNTALVGAPAAASTGKAFVFVRSGATWAQQAALTASDAAANAAFGSAVSLSGDGNTALVGAPLANGSKGEAYVFVRSGGAWAQQGSPLLATDTGTDTAFGPTFGSAVALSNDGNTAAIGAGGADVGSVADAGKVYLFARSGGSWVQQGSPVAAADASAGNIFGSAVALSGDGSTLLAGAPDATVGGLSAAGKAYVVERGTATATVSLTPKAVLPKAVGISGSPNGQAQTFTFDASGNLSATGDPFTPFSGFSGDVRTAVADIDGDGKPDTVYGVGPGGGSQLRIVTSTGLDISLPAVYEATFTGGVFLAAGDIDGDGKAEIVVSPDVGGGGRVVVFRLNAAGNGLDRIADFFGIDDPNFRGGARVAVGDINGDGILDLVVAAGFGGGPRVAIFDGKSVLTNGNSPIKLRGDFFVFEQTLRNGVFVASGDFDGDSKGDIAFGGGPGGGPRVFILSGVNLLGSADPASTAPLANFFAGDPNQRGGIRLAAKDIDGDGKADLITGSGEGFPAQVRTYLGKNVITAANGSEPTVQQTFTPFGGPVSAAGIYVG